MDIQRIGEQHQLNNAGSPASVGKAVSPPVSQAPPPASVELNSVKQALVKINQVVSAIAPNLQFSLDQSTGKTVVKVVDTQTSEVIRQFPSEEMLAISRAIDRLQGLLVRDKA